MSDALPDLASWLPSEFLTRHHDHKPLLFPNEFPYEFASSSSTESESDDDDIAAFTRCVSLQERLKIPHPLHVKKRVFSGSPESALNWVVCGPAQVRSSPLTPYEKNAWDLVYAAAGQVARMKMRMNNVNDDAYGHRGLLRPPSYHHHHHHPHCAIRRAENQEFIRQQQFRQRVDGGGGRCGVGRPVVYRQCSWPPLPVENQRPSNGLVGKADLVGCCLGTPVVKRECAGTGVFLPRRYCKDPPESKRKPGRVVQSFNKNMDTEAQPSIHGGYGTQCGRRTLGGNNSQVGVPEEVILPQEWTY